MKTIKLLLIVAIAFACISLNSTVSESKGFTLDLTTVLDTGTVYHPTVGQCDDTPLITADCSKIDLKKLPELRWVALSRDLLTRWDGPYHYGDTIIVEHKDERLNGKWIVHDTMNKRYKNRMDFLQHKKGLFGRWFNIKITKKVRDDLWGNKKN